MKTIEEAAKEYQTKIYEDVFEEGSLSEQKLQCINDFKAGVAFAEEWISVKDEPIPSETEFLLIKFDNGEIKRFDEENWPFAIATHWRPYNRK